MNTLYQNMLLAMASGAGIGFIYGALVGVQLPGLNKWKLPVYQVALLGVYSGIIYAALGCVYFSILGIIAAFTPLKETAPLNLFYIYSAIGFLAIAYYVMKWAKK